MGDKPIKEIRSGSVKISIWSKKVDGYDMYSAKIVKVFKDNKGEWQETNYFNKNEMFNLYIAVQEASKYLLMNTQKESDL